MFNEVCFEIFSEIHLHYFSNMRVLNMKNIFLFTLGVLLTFTTPVYSKNFSIADVEKIGFQKGDQQYYQMIGAIDGWGGKLNGETVEVYIFKNKKKINNDFFESMVPGDTWKDYCKKDNVAMISKGNSACNLLKKLK